MTGRKSRALQVPPVVSYKASGKFLKALYGTTRGTCSARLFRPVMVHNQREREKEKYMNTHKKIQTNS